MTTTIDDPPLQGWISSTFEVRDVDTANGTMTRLAGIAAPYGVRTDIGSFTEEFAVGAFRKSIKEAARGLPLLMHHDPRLPIGVAERWFERSDGLHAEWRLDTGERAQEAARQAREGILSYLSVNFCQIPGKLDISDGEHKPHVVRREARLVETSLTPTPAYAGSAVAWVRHHDQPQPVVESNRHEWEMFLRRLRTGI